MRRSPSADCETPATPERRTKKRSPGSPSRMSTVPGSDLLTLHAVGELPERLAGEVGEQPDTGQLRHRRGDMSGRHGAVRYRRGGPGQLASVPPMRRRSQARRRMRRVRRLRVRALREPGAGGVRARARRRRPPASRSTCASSPTSACGTRSDGFLEEGEDATAGLRRELREEAGVEIEVGAFVGILPGPVRGQRKTLRRTSTSCARPRS